MSETHTLFVQRTDDTTEKLPELFAEKKVETAFVSTPDKLYVAKAADGIWIVADDKGVRPLDAALLATAYEVRAFGLKAELRWTRNGHSGKTIILSEDGAGTRYSCIARLPRKYLLWRDAESDRAEALEGWSAVAASRIGKVLVPSTPGAGRLCLQAYEYVQAGLHGNAFVLAERYAGFIRVTPDQIEDAT
jgi:CRISPR-associated protein (TIGR03984 family)